MRVSEYTANMALAERAPILARRDALKLIYRHTHPDFKSRSSIFGGKSILVLRNGATCLVALNDLTEQEIQDRLPIAMRKEQARRAA